jgi:hypothetical protein
MDMFTEDEGNALRRACGQSELPTRNRALLELLIFTGQRLGALLTLRIGDVDTREGYIYLNDDYIVWHCLRGEERGLAEASPCTYYEIVDSLYLVVWEEIVLPVVGVILIDLQALKTTGKMLCDDKNDFENAVNIPMGAHAEPLNVTPTLD